MRHNRMLCDLHLHSKYAGATSERMDARTIAHWAKLKGLDLVGTGDFTHPRWREELRRTWQPNLIPTSEVSLVFKKGEKVKKVHMCMIAPDLDTADEIARALQPYGDLAADGRPTLMMTPEEFLKTVKQAADVIVFAAHIWTPWYSIFGSKFGCDSLQECFGDAVNLLDGIETGLSSDPPMNWMVSSLDRFTLVSFSDAHSPENIGREATAFDVEPTYDGLKQAFKGKARFTIEFFPEEGKYHWDGHRKCGVRVSPEEYDRLGGICPKCGRRMTKGVLHRVYDLRDRNQPKLFHPFYKLVPLREVIAQMLQVGKYSKRVYELYTSLVQKKPELELLLHPDERVLGKTLADALRRVLEGKIHVSPGYDGVYGEIKVFPTLADY